MKRETSITSPPVVSIRLRENERKARAKETEINSLQLSSQICLHATVMRWNIQTLWNLTQHRIIAASLDCRQRVWIRIKNIVIQQPFSDKKCVSHGQYKRHLPPHVTWLFEKFFNHKIYAKESRIHDGYDQRSLPIRNWNQNENSLNYLFVSPSYVG